MNKCLDRKVKVQGMLASLRAGKVFKSVEERELSLQEMRAGKETAREVDSDRQGSRNGPACAGDARAPLGSLLNEDVRNCWAPSFPPEHWPLAWQEAGRKF